MTLRGAIVAICAILIVFAIGEAMTGWGSILLIAAQAAIVLALIVFERSRYRPKVDTSSSLWKPTGERFQDPTSGETVEVYENPQTGERDYRHQT